MNVTIRFVSMPGDVQVDAVTLRVNTDDFALAVARATEFVKTFTSVTIASILIEVK